MARVWCHSHLYGIFGILGPPVASIMVHAASLDAKTSNVAQIHVNSTYMTLKKCFYGGFTLNTTQGRRLVQR